MVKKSKRTNKRNISKRHYRKKNKKTRKIYKRKMMRGGAGDQSKLIQVFVEHTGVDGVEAFERISKANGNLPRACKASLLRERNSCWNSLDRGSKA